MKRMCVVAISFVISIAMAQDANRQQNESKSSAQPATQTQPAKLGQSAQSYKGTLVDASCNTPSGTASAATPADANRQTSDSKESKDRSTQASPAAAANSGQACSVSASTSQFALKLDDGRTVPFDSVGNLRVQQAFKDKKKWNEAAASGKPVRAKVSGFMSDDRLMVLSIN